MTTKKHTNETFIAKSIEVHGDIYSYELVEYKNSKTKVKIVCKEHGVYEQQPSNHLSGVGCKICSNEALASTAKSEFEEKANLTHNNKYTYELVDYKNNATKVKIICPIHGSFEQTPGNHLASKGCPICANENKGGRMDSYTL